MYKTIKKLSILSAAIFFLISCNGNNPHNRGIEAGKAACECYKLEDFEAVDSCMKRIERDNAEFIHDSAYTNAMEEQFLRCLTDDVSDIVK